jgi:hypothetical protein
LQHFQHPCAVCCFTRIAATLCCQVLLHLPQTPCAALEGTLCTLQLLLLGLRERGIASVAWMSSSSTVVAVVAEADA